MNIKILMFGWEFPPYNSGGLGVACSGLSNALARMPQTEITFVLPKSYEGLVATRCRLVSADQFHANKKRGRTIFFKSVDTLLFPYVTEKSYRSIFGTSQRRGEVFYYGKNLFDEIARYAAKARIIAESADFDVIHAHDWLSFGAGLAAREATGKPLVVHVHATEYDRTGGVGGNPVIHEMERLGMSRADKVIAVSNLTKATIMQKYGIPAEKIEVVHNGVDYYEHPASFATIDSFKELGYKVVVFVGRVTVQKGPDYFIRAARRVLDYDKKVVFVIAGSGDMERKIIEQSAEIGLARNIIFTGFLRGDELQRVYQSADLFVMSSVSEPFGITALEAAINETPVLLSKQSGVAEVLTHALKADFWDTDLMANYIIAAIRDPALRKTLREEASREVKRVSWRAAAEKCLKIYRAIV